MRRPFVLAALTLASLSAAGQQVFVAGEGSRTCGNYLESRQQNEKTQSYIYVTWIRGFLTGVNSSIPKKHLRSIPDAATIFAYFDKYCKDNPLKTLYAGSLALDQEVFPDR